MKNDQEKFLRYLFRAAFCFMACDGHFDDREIAEIKSMAGKTSYFKGIDVERELQLLMNNVKMEGRGIFKHFVDDLVKHEFDIVQELMLLEVALRVIYIDVKLEANEVKFLRLLRSKLDVPDEIIRQRFGKVDVLFSENKRAALESSETQHPELAFGTPELDTQLKALDLDGVQPK